MKRLAALVSGLMAMAFVLIPVSTVHASTEHCVDHASEVKVETVDGQASEVVQVYDRTTDQIVDVLVVVDGSTVSFYYDYGNGWELVVANFCIKAATGTVDGEAVSGSTVTIPNNGGQTPDISYVVVYFVITTPPEEPPAAEWCSPGFWSQNLVQTAAWLDSDGKSLGTPYSELSTGVPVKTYPRKSTPPGYTSEPSIGAVLARPDLYGGAAFNAVADYLSTISGINFTNGERVENACPFSADEARANR